MYAPLAICAAMFLSVGFLMGSSYERHMMKAEAIRHGAALYDAQSGEFKWK